MALVDWADEEGARFSRSLFGSAACVGTLDIDVLRGLTDREGDRLPEILAAHGVDTVGQELLARAAEGRGPTLTSSLWLNGGIWTNFNGLTVGNAANAQGNTLIATNLTTFGGFGAINGQGEETFPCAAAEEAFFSVSAFIPLTPRIARRDDAL